jgi:hypothetical protein
LEVIACIRIQRGLTTAISKFWRLDLDMTLYYGWRGVGDGLEKVEEVTEGLNNMCTMVRDIISSVARWKDMVMLGVAAKNLVTTLDLSQPRVVLGEGLKDIHG